MDVTNFQNRIQVFGRLAHPISCSCNTFKVSLMLDCLIISLFCVLLVSGCKKWHVFCLHCSWQCDPAEVVGDKRCTRQLCIHWHRSEWSRLSSHICQLLALFALVCILKKFLTWSDVVLMTTAVMFITRVS